MNVMDAVRVAQEARQSLSRPRVSRSCVSAGSTSFRRGDPSVQFLRRRRNAAHAFVFVARLLPISAAQVIRSRSFRKCELMITMKPNGLLDVFQYCSVSDRTDGIPDTIAKSNTVECPRAASDCFPPRSVSIKIDTGRLSDPTEKNLAHSRRGRVGPVSADGKEHRSRRVAERRNHPRHLQCL